MLTITRNLNVYSSGIPQIINLSQYDSDFQLVFNLYTSQGTLTIPSGTTAEIQGTKKSGTGYSAAAALAGNTVTVTGDNQMTACAGANVFEISLKNNGKVLNTVNFILVVERATLDGDTIQDETVLKELQAIIDGVEDAEQAAQDAEAAADRAEAAAEDLSETAQQVETNKENIATNTEDIADLKEDFNQITTESENIYNPSAMRKGLYISSNGTETEDATSETSDYIEVVGGSAYARNTLAQNRFFAYYDENKTFLSRVNAWYSRTGTIPENARYIRFSAYQTAFPDDFMFVYGSAVPEQYLPHYIIDTNAMVGLVDKTLTVSGKAADSAVVGDRFAEIVQRTSNLYNYKTNTNGYYIHSNGTLQPNANSAVSDFIAVEPSSKYTHTSATNLYYAEYDENQTFLSRYSANGTITTTASCKYIRFSEYQTAFPDGFMVVSGETLPSAYVAYEQINPELLPEADTAKVKVEKVSNTQIDITTGKGKHVLTHQTNTSKNLDTWRLTAGYANGQALWSEVDVEGPIKQKDVSDFMGGYHGDEMMTAVTFIIDGAVKTISEIESGECDSFIICVTSDIYYDGDATNKAFVRQKRLVFEGNKLQIFNTYKYIGSSEIQIDVATGTGLYPVSSNVVNGYTTNTGNVYIHEETTNRNKELDRVSFFGDGFTMNLKVLFGKGENYYGVVYYYSDQTRYKAYFYQQYANGQNYLTLTNGNELYSGYEIEFV